ncbi:hypothetical protein B0G82_6333 [Paraburkholderia sp. BL17N1]|nr:hypothetical protein B0G82_6333 [Paraburkholderia sp. BL17N1]
MLILLHRHVLAWGQSKRLLPTGIRRREMFGTYFCRRRHPDSSRRRHSHPHQFDNDRYGETSGVGGNGCKPVCLLKLYRT